MFANSQLKMSSAAAEEDDSASGSDDDGFVSDFSDAKLALDSVTNMVYMNGILVGRILSFVPSVKDRLKIEACSRRMRRLSLSSTYLNVDDDNSVLDMHFRMVAPCATFWIAGNSFDVPALCSETRTAECSEVNRDAQPASMIEAFKGIVTRFSRQVSKARIGSISDIERRFGFIPAHQFVLTTDFCMQMEKLKHLDTISFRDILLSGPALDYLRSGQSTLMQNVTTLCFHSLWFDRVDDCTTFVDVLSGRVKHLNLSDCSAKTLDQFVSRLAQVGAQLSTITVAIDYRTFRSGDGGARIFRRMSAVTNEIHLCVLVTNFFLQPAHRILMGVLGDLKDIETLTSIDFDMGSLRRFFASSHKRFFRVVKGLPKLRRLALTGHPEGKSAVLLWTMIVDALPAMEHLTELSISHLGKMTSRRLLDGFCAALPHGLSMLHLYDASNFGDEQLDTIAETCPKLKMLAMSDLRGLTPNGLVRALSKLPGLRGFCCLPVCADDAFLDCLADRQATPSLEAVILGCSSLSPTSVWCRLRRRFPWTPDCRCERELLDSGYSMWSIRGTYLELCRFMTTTVCPCCGKDFCLLSNDDFD